MACSIRLRTPVSATLECPLGHGGSDQARVEDDMCMHGRHPVGAEVEGHFILISVSSDHVPAGHASWVGDNLDERTRRRSIGWRILPFDGAVTHQVGGSPLGDPALLVDTVGIDVPALRLLDLDIIGLRIRHRLTLEKTAPYCRVGGT